MNNGLKILISLIMGVFTLETYNMVDPEIMKAMDHLENPRHNEIKEKELSRIPAS